MKVSAIGIALLCASAAAGPALVFDLGGRTAHWDQNHQPGLGGTAGLSFLAGADLEIGTRVDYAFFQSLGPAVADLEIRDASLTTYFAPYNGALRPMIGAHVGVAAGDAPRLNNVGTKLSDAGGIDANRAGRQWDWDLGLDALILYDFGNALVHRPQFYSCVTPGILFGPGTEAFWVRLGLGIRISFRP